MWEEMSVKAFRTDQSQKGSVQQRQLNVKVSQRRWRRSVKTEKNHRNTENVFIISLSHTPVI